MKCKDGGQCGLGGFCKDCHALGASDSSAVLERELREAFEKWISAEPLPELLARIDWMQAAFNAFEAGMEHEREACKSDCWAVAQKYLGTACELAAAECVGKIDERSNAALEGRALDNDRKHEDA